MTLAALPFPEISPEIFSIEIGTMTFALRWYALAYIAGLFLGWRLCLRLIRQVAHWPDQTPPLTAQQLEQLLNWIVLGVILGGRLGFVLFYQPEHYLTRPLDVLKIWQGGMSFHGGFLGVSVAVLVFAWRNRLSVFGIADLLALSAPPIGLFLGRLANFINAELWGGRPTSLPWGGVVFPGEAAQFCPGVVGLCARHPSQVYEAVLEVGARCSAADPRLAVRMAAEPPRSPDRCLSCGLWTGSFSCRVCPAARPAIRDGRQPDRSCAAFWHWGGFDHGGATAFRTHDCCRHGLIWRTRNGRQSRTAEKHAEMG